MATLILTAAGNFLGGPIGGAVGAVLGQAIDAELFAPKARHGPRLGELAVQTSSYGTAIPKLFGTMRVAGTVIWATDLIERRSTSSNGKGKAKTIDYSYVANFAVALSARAMLSVGRIWADGNLLRGAGGDFKVRTGFRLHLGDEEQEVDPLIAAAEGAGSAPAFRGIAYAVFEEMELAEFGNRIPSLSFEVISDAGEVEIARIGAALSVGMLAGAASGSVSGYAASGDSVRGAIGELAALDGLILTDDGTALSLGQPGEAGPAPAREFESGKRKLVRQGAANVPSEVTLTHYEPERDYQPGMQRAALGAAGAGRSERRGVAAAMSADAAKQRAERRLDTAWAERVTASIAYGWRGADVRPGAVLTLAGETGAWRVRRWTLGDMMVTLDLVRIAAGGALADGAGTGRPVSEPDVPHGPTALRLYDLPLAELGFDGKPALAAMAAGIAPGWRRAALSMSADNGASRQDIGSTVAPAMLGATLGALPAGGSALLDLSSFVEVELLHEEMVLTGCSEDALAAGANLALIGNELIQFGDAEPIGARQWRLSRLLRGRRGTEWAVAEHGMGEDFALIEVAAIRPVEVASAASAGTRILLLASGTGDDEPATAEMVTTGEALRPPAPVHLRAESDGAGGIALTWVRRSRFGWAWQNGADTPLGEENERYLLAITGDGFTRNAEIDLPAFAYDAAMRAADGPGPVSATIVQLGTHGRSRPATITFD